jgi:hypothetical protein
MSSLKPHQEPEYMKIIKWLMAHPETVVTFSIVITAIIIFMVLTWEPVTIANGGI